MLEKDPCNRLTASQAISHEAFDIMLSKSPMKANIRFDNKEILEHHRITEKYIKKHEHYQ